MSGLSESEKKAKATVAANRVRRHQLYVIQWLDICSDATWHDGNPSTANPATCCTVGWLVHECAAKIVLADSRAKDGDWGGLTVIPSGVIVNRQRISAKAPEAFMG